MYHIKMNHINSLVITFFLLVLHMYLYFIKVPGGLYGEVHYVDFSGVLCLTNPRLIGSEIHSQILSSCTGCTSTGDPCKRVKQSLMRCDWQSRVINNSLTWTWTALLHSNSDTHIYLTTPLKVVWAPRMK